MAGIVCNDDRFELIEKYKNKLIESTNIETAKDEMAAIDSILFRFWQMGWLDKLENFDRQKAEIERLNDSYEKLYLKYDDVINDNKFLKRKNNEQKAEIERSQAMHKEMCIGMKVLKRKAVKEFAERLKDATMPVTLGGKYRYDVITKEGIDNLVKEMEGESK